MADSTGMADLRAENVSKVVTGFALQAYKLKPLCTITTSSAWIESFYAETKTELAGADLSIQGVSRLANFPYAEPTQTKKYAYMLKFGLDSVISIEDITTNNVPMIARTLLRVGRAVAKAVDDKIFADILAAAGINTFALTALFEWNAVAVANRDPLGDILKAKRYLSVDNYEVDDGNTYLLVNPIEYEYILKNSKVVSNPSFKAEDVVENGKVAKIAGVQIVVSNSFTTTYAVLLKGKESVTWQEALALKVETINDPGVKTTIRAYEMGCTQVTNPESICVITGVTI